MGRDFNALLQARWDAGRFLCVGLDPELEKIPEHMRNEGTRQALVAFNRAIFDATKDIVAAYKPNSAFYEAHGDQGVEALRETIQYIHEQNPEMPIILDAKRADIGSTNEGYARAVFDHLGADAVTLQPYLGREALQPFLNRKGRGAIILCRTSNPGAGEFQDMLIEGRPLYQHVAEHVTNSWNENGNCGLVVGATYPKELAEIRAIAPDLLILIPGIGAQNGDLDAAVRAGKDARGKGMLISTSRAVLYASDGIDFAQAARRKAQEYDSAIRAAL